MAENVDSRIQGSSSEGSHSDGSSHRQVTPPPNKKLNFNDECLAMEEQARVKYEEAQRKAEELRERLRLIREVHQQEDRGKHADYTRVLAENKALRSQMQDLMREVRSLGKCPEKVCSPEELNKIANEVERSIRGAPHAPFIATYPFTERVMRVEVPTKFRIPTVMPYNGTTDPNSFVATYRQHMVIHGWADALLCRTFPSLLSGPTQEWFEDLPKNTIATFEELAKKFCQYFSSQRRIKENPEKLAHIRQTTGEAFGAFLKRFRD